MLEVELNGKPVNAMVYIMNDGREFGAPSDFYLHTIAEEKQEKRTTKRKELKVRSVVARIPSAQK